MFNFKKGVKKVLPDSTGKINLNEYRLVKNLDKNIQIMNQIFKDDGTLIKRIFQNQQDSKIECCAFFIDGMVNNILINDNVIKPIVINKSLAYSSKTIDLINTQVLFSNDVKKSDDLNEIVESVLYGDTALFINGASSALIINSKGWKMRSISEPISEKTVRGPHEGLTESILTNVSLIRRRLKTSDLKIKYRKIGTRSNTKACLCYVDSIVDKKILKEFESRLDKLNIDGVMDTNYISELIKDSRYSPFKTIGTTERPDTVAADLLEGRVALILDGSPEALTVPYLFIENFQSCDDYYINFYFSSINRILRLLAFLISTSLPAIYLSLVCYHKEMIPTALALSIAQSHQGVPFPTIVECLIMLFVFEILREAGSRMPSNIGQSLSIVGALVIGQAAVEAKIISAPIVIIVAFTAITGLMNMKIKGATVIIRTIFLFLSAIIGLYGFFFGFIGLLIHLLGLRSFGINYTSFFTSNKLQEAKDILIRSPAWAMKTRPKFMSKNKIRMQPDEDKTV